MILEAIGMFCFIAFCIFMLLKFSSKYNEYLDEQLRPLKEIGVVPL